MKLDFPRAIALLATGAACIWLARSPQSSSPGANAGTDQKVPALLASHTESGESNAAVPGQLLADSILQLQSFEGLLAQVDVHVDILGEKSSATGSYTQSGQGIPKARWDLNFSSSDLSLDMSQVFDGRFHYRLTNFAGKKSLEYIDLSQIPELPEPKVHSVAGPTGWFGVGGLATMLRQLQGSFVFQLVNTEDTTVRDHKIVFQTVRGTWKPDALRELLRGQVDPSWLEPEVKWERLPIQIPHAVEITFGSDGYLNNFPYRIVFLQKDGPEPDSRFRDFISLKLHHVARKNDFAADTFTVTADDTEPVDKTGDYLGRVRMFLFQPAR